MPTPHTLVLRSAKRTHCGHVRAHNEDSAAARDAEGLYCVADGLGGQPGGEVASGVAVAEVLKTLRARSDEAAEAAFRLAATEAHDELLAYGERYPDMWGLGTTLTALRYAGGSTAQVLHVGDSRAYRYRRGVLEPLTSDHSVVFELVRSGQLTREQARVHPRANLLAQCVGGGGDAPIPELLDVAIEPGDRLLLATDGITDMVPEAAIAALCGAHEDRSALADALVAAALSYGGRDNITVIVIDAAAQ